MPESYQERRIKAVSMTLASSKLASASAAVVGADACTEQINEAAQAVLSALDRVTPDDHVDQGVVDDMLRASGDREPPVDVGGFGL